MNDGDTNSGVLTEVFSEYGGDQTYNDFTIAGGDVTVIRLNISLRSASSAHSDKRPEAGNSDSLSAVRIKFSAFGTDT